MNRFVLAAVSLAISGAAVTACGGVSGDSLFGAGGATTGSGSSSSTTSSGQSSSGATSSGQASSTSSTSTSTSSTSSTSTSSTSSTSTSSTSSTSTSSGSTSPVYCAGAPCPAGDICCFNPLSGQPPDHCGKHQQCGTGFTEVSCSSPAACPGQYCCAQFVLTGNPPQQFREYTAIACQATCNNPATEIIVCNPADAAPCPFGGTCVMSTLLGAGYYVCN